MLLSVLWWDNVRMYQLFRFCFGYGSSVVGVLGFEGNSKQCLATIMMIPVFRFVDGDYV